MPIHIENVTLAGFGEEPPRTVDIGVGASGILDWIVEPGTRAYDEDAQPVRINARGMLALPTLVTTHARLAAAPLLAFAGAAGGHPGRIRDTLGTLGGDDLRVLAALGTMRAARRGIGVVFDLTPAAAAVRGTLGSVAQGVEDLGLRAVVAWEVDPGDDPARVEDGIAENLAFIQECIDRTGLQSGPRLAGVMGAASPADLAPATLEKLAPHAGNGFHLSLGLDAGERDRARERHGATALELARELGLLTKRSVVVGGAHLDPSEREQVLALGAILSHPVRDALDEARGVPDPAPALSGDGTVGIATGYQDLDVLGELQAAYLACQTRGEGGGLGAVAGYLRGSARAAERFLRSLQLTEVREGQPADLTLWKTVGAEHLGSGDVPALLARGLRGAELQGTMVGGRWVYFGGEFPLFHDRETVLREARVLLPRLREHLGAGA